MTAVRAIFGDRHMLTWEHSERPLTHAWQVKGRRDAVVAKAYHNGVRGVRWCGFAASRAEADKKVAAASRRLTSAGPWNIGMAGSIESTEVVEVE